VRATGGGGHRRLIPDGDVPVADLNDPLALEAFERPGHAGPYLTSVSLDEAVGQVRFVFEKPIDDDGAVHDFQGRKNPARTIKL
jgi:hypothetical protein